LFANVLAAWYYQIKWDGKENKGKAVASGIYLYQLKAGDFLAVRKMLLLL
jgi:hypothetical protein